MELSNVVPWGRSLSEYIAMFSLTNSDLKKKILGCGDGPACFNAESTLAGCNIVSVDPIYQFSKDEIRKRIDEVYPVIMKEMEKNKDDFVWNDISSVEELGSIRMNAMNNFLADYDNGKKSGRYIDASLPVLPFDDGEFDLALCSHYLFLYSEHVTQEQHILSVRELCRVAKEVRIYPLHSIRNNKKSPHLDAVMSCLKSEGIKTTLTSVGYEFQSGANEMIVAKRP